ncbi:pyrroline-5-carboxylate reductase [Capsaspora owczarzaki ATCC 30864]|uniref:Pyrroline-5-carboxylate reductase n=2 Tax=Capsaspora owczarzaki (strain ATCC 30864) TaxID=595528 RepID=A0A0D2X2Y5_CAPO3|nr:pyrroline-5-carboxylate reductase [Capsaspora owczarzaki ATCC 30864]
MSTSAPTAAGEQAAPSATAPLTLDRLAVVGCGVMGKAIVKGLIDNNFVAPAHVTASVASDDSASALGAYFPGSTIVRDNITAIKSADVVLLCIKPFYVRTVLSEPAIVAALQGKLLISICAGITLAQFAALIPNTRVVRAMTNTPARIRQGMTAVCGGAAATKQDVLLTVKMFQNVGRCIELPETQFDTVTALAGSGPAFAFMFIESLADGAVMMGMPRKIALEMAAQMVFGSAKLALDSGEHPALLKDSVTTPGGCTIAGLLSLEDNKFRGSVARCIEATSRRASELGQPKK